MSESTQLATRPRASHQLAALIGMEPNAMLDTIKAQCFKGNPQNISNEQLAAFVSIAAEMGVNPLLPGMLYAYPTSGGGVVPILGPDAVFKKLSERQDIDYWETVVYPEDVTLPPTHAVSKIYMKGRSQPLTKTCLLSEWKVDANPNWRTRPRHQLEIRALKQNARQVIHGIPYDEDERVIMGEINVTPTAEPEAPARPAAPKRSSKGAAAVQENPAPKAPVIDAEVVPAATQTASDADLAKSAAERIVANDREAKAKAEALSAKLASEAAANRAEAENPAPAMPQPRAFLKDGEEFTTTANVTAVAPLIVKSGGEARPSVSVELRGGFHGSALHIGGGTIPDGQTDPVPLPVWQKGASVHVTLRGKLNKASGKVLVIVDKVTEASPASPEMDVE